MSNLNEQTVGNEPAAARTSPEQRVCPVEPAADGTLTPGPAGGQAPQPEAAAEAPSQAVAAPQGSPYATDRAEAIVDTLAHWVGHLAAQGTRKLASFAARAREALQDFWAEVQDFRHGRKP
jgi:hypothetical protein